MKFADIQAYATLILMFALIYFMVFAPQKKRAKQIQELQDSLKVGEEIITAGGIVGKIININNDVLTIEASAEKTKINIKKWAVREVITPKK